VSVIARPIHRSLRAVLARDLIEQGVGERLTKAVFAAGLLWLAIWWALS
jgi:hypothetical protein